MVSKTNESEVQTQNELILDQIGRLWKETTTDVFSSEILSFQCMISSVDLKGAGYPPLSVLDRKVTF